MEHGFRRFFEAEEDADFGFFALDGRRADRGRGRRDVPGLDGEDDLLGVSAAVVVEVEPSVDALVRALLLLGRTRAHQAERPPLELVRVLLGQLRCASRVGRLADDLVGVLDLGAEGIAQALLDQGDGQVGDVDADPAAAELLRGGDRRAAAAEGIEHDVAFVALALMMRSRRASGFWVG